MSAQVTTPNGHTPAVTTWTEAPASATVEAYDSSGRRWLLTTRAATTGELLTRLPVLTGWLDDHGWQARTPGKAQAQADDEPAPLCSICNQPMKRRQTKDGSRSFWSCSTKYGNGQWCQGKPKQDSQ